MEKKSVKSQGHLTTFRFRFTTAHGTTNNWLELMHGFNAKIGFDKFALSPEISTKVSVSWDLVHIFQTRFFHWNHELKPLTLSTRNPLNGKIFSNYKWPQWTKIIWDFPNLEVVWWPSNFQDMFSIPFTIKISFRHFKQLFF